MSDDARFEDAREGPLRLRALDTGDLAVISALVQDAVFPASEMRWDRKRRQFALLLNRYRWEDRSPAAERVQAVLAFEYVTRVNPKGSTRARQTLSSRFFRSPSSPAKRGRAA